MARTAADRPTATSTPVSATTRDTTSRESLCRKRSIGTSKEETDPKSSRMDRDEPMQEEAGKSKLSKANLELYEMMRQYMDQKFEGLGDRVDRVKDEVSHNTQAINGLASEVNKNKDDIEKMSSQIRDLKKKSGGVDEQKVERMIERAVERKLADSNLKPDSIDTAHRPTGDSDVQRQYWFARKCVRCWPIRGDTPGELAAAVGNFFGDKLGIAPSSIREDDIQEIRRLVPRTRPHRDSNRSQPIRDEVLVVLKEVQTRDMVFKHASNLTAWREGDKPNAIGIRLQIPTSLLGKFNTLNQHGFDLKRKYGHGLKRHIRFNDAELDLVMDVQLPNTTNWIEVDYEFALEETKIQKKARAGPRGRLSSLGLLGTDAAAEVTEGAPRSAPPTTDNRRHELTTARRSENGAFQWGCNS